MMANLANALEVLLKHSGIPEENEDRDVVQEVIESLHNPVAKSTSRTPKEDK